MRILSLALLVLALAILYCVFPRRCPAQAAGIAARNRTGIIVDFQSGEVDGVNFRDPVDKIKAALGPSAVKEETEELEGESTKVYVISFTGHKVYKHWNAFSWRDSIFVTKEGLKVGSSLADFDKLYGVGQIGASEGLGEAVYYHPKSEQQVCAVVPPECRPRNSCIVTEIWVW
jgi:hypothetical protein